MMMTTLFACLCVFLFGLTNAQVQVDSNVTLSSNDSGELELDYDYVDEQSILDLLTKIDSV